MDAFNPGTKLALGNIANALQFNGDPRSLIENAITGNGNDTLVGNAANNHLRGLGGDDLLRGGPGSDRLDGGAGFDYAGYSDSPVGVRVSVANSRINIGDAAGDIFTSIEAFQLSSFDDIFYGGGGQNFAFGSTGADLLLVDVGLTLSRDYFYGGDGGDSLYGGPLRDQLSGGPGRDVYNFENFFDGGGPGDLITTSSMASIASICIGIPASTRRSKARQVSRWSTA